MHAMWNVQRRVAIQATSHSASACSTAASAASCYGPASAATSASRSASAALKQWGNLQACGARRLIHYTRCVRADASSAAASSAAPSSSSSRPSSSSSAPRLIVAHPRSGDNNKTSSSGIKSSSAPAPGPWLFLADMHFDYKRLHRLEKTCQWILSEVARLQPSHIFLLGDTLHTRNDVHVEASSAVATFLQRLLHTVYRDGSPSAQHVHLLVGNHDMHHASSRRVTSLDSFAVHQTPAPNQANNDTTKPSQAINYTTVASTEAKDDASNKFNSAAVAHSSSSSSDSSHSASTSLLSASSLSRLHMYRELSFVSIDGQKVLFVPYHHGADVRLVESFVTNLARHHSLDEIVCLAHLPLSGATISGIAMEAASGYKYAHSAVSLTQLSQFQRVFLGHFHIHQLVGSSGKVLYVGAPQQFNYGDANDDRKGFVSYDPKHDERGWILHKNPFGQHYFSRGIAEWEQQIASASVAAANKPGSSNPPLSPLLDSLRGKCIEITLPPGMDSILHAKSIHVLCNALKTQYEIEDLKIKQLKKSGAGAKEGGVEKANDDGTLVDTPGDDPLSFASSTVAATSAPDSLVSDIVNGDLRPLVRKYIAEDSSVSKDNKSLFENVMLGMLESIDSELKLGTTAASSAAASKSGVHSSKLFRAQLARMEINNFLSVQGTVSFDFSQLAPGIWYICGKNGSGKSLLLEALTWTLFGKTLRGFEQDRTGRATSGLAMDEVINDTASAMDPSASVQVSVRFANGFMFTRSHTKGVSGSTLRIMNPSGQMIEPKSSKRLDEEYACSLLGIGFERFVSSVLLSSTTKNFISARPEDKRRIIEELLGFTHFELVHAQFKDSRVEVKSKRDSLESKLESLKVRTEELQGSLNKILASKSAKSNELTKLQQSLSESNTKSQALLTKQKEAESAEAKLTSTKSELANQIADIQSQLDSLLSNPSSSLLLDSSKVLAQAEAKWTDLRNKGMTSAHAGMRAADDRLRSLQLKKIQMVNKENLRLLAKIASITRLDHVSTQIKEAKKQVESTMKGTQTPTAPVAASSSSKSKSSASTASDPDIPVIASVIDALTEVTADVNSHAASRLELEAISPLTALISRKQEAWTTQASETQDRLGRLQGSIEKLEIQSKELMEELGMDHALGLGSDEINKLIASLPALRAEQAALAALSESSGGGSPSSKSASKSSSASSSSSSASSSSKQQQQLLSERDSDPEWLAASKSLLEFENPASSSNAAIIDALAAIQSARKNLDALTSSVASQKELELSLGAQRKSLDSSLALANKQESSVRSTLKSLGSDLAALVVTKARNEKELELAVKSMGELEGELERTKASFESSRVAHDTSKLALDALNTQLNALAYWQDRVSDAPTKQAGSFRSFCIQRVLGLLNPLLQSNLTLFSTDDTGAISHALGAHLTADLTLVADAGATSMDKRSEGQRKRTHLALFLSLFTLSQRRSQFQNAFLWLDEAFDSLDEDGQKAVNAWIQMYAANGDRAAAVPTPTTAGGDESAPAVASPLRPLVFVITHSPYRHPSVSNGAIHVSMSAINRASTYKLVRAEDAEEEAPATSTPAASSSAQKPFVIQSMQQPLTSAAASAAASSTVTAAKLKPRSKSVASQAQPQPQPTAAAIEAAASNFDASFIEVETDGGSIASTPTPTPAAKKPSGRVTGRTTNKKKINA